MGSLKKKFMGLGKRFGVLEMRFGKRFGSPGRGLEVYVWEPTEEDVGCLGNGLGV